MHEQRCRYCNASIAFIMTRKGHLTPVEFASVRRMSSNALPEGKYYDRYGTFYNHYDAPLTVELWRSHWSDCPGADEARRKNKNRNETK